MRNYTKNHTLWFDFAPVKSNVPYFQYPETNNQSKYSVILISSKLLSIQNLY